MTDFPPAMLVPEDPEHGKTSHEEPRDEWQADMFSPPQPIIGIPVPITQGDQGPLLVADAVGAWAVERMRGGVFLIPLWPFPTHKHVYQSLWPLMQSMDGLLVPAGIPGTDWHALWKKQEPGPESWSISWEMALIQLATYMSMPVLGIGDGAEKWNSALGGKRGDIPRDPKQTQRTTPDTWERHTIRVRAQSTLAAALQPAITQQNGEPKPWDLAFLPQQGVEQLASGLRSCAQSEEKTIVAFERRDEAFGLGVLGRLDWGLDQAYGSTLFETFLSACQSFDCTRQQQQGWEAARDTICATVYDQVTRGQSLVSVSQDEKHARFRPLSTPPPALYGSGEPARARPRSRQPTREEWKKIRRQRLKGAL